MKTLHKLFASLLLSSSFIAPASHAIEIEGTCDGPDKCDIDLSGTSFKTDTGITINSDNIIGWSMINTSSLANGIIVKPRHEDYRFLIKYFDNSGNRQLTQIGFYNWKTAQVFISSLQLMSGLGPNHDQSGAPTKCTYNGISKDSGTYLVDPVMTEGLIDRATSLYMGGLIGSAIGGFLEDPFGGSWDASAGTGAAFGTIAGTAIVESLMHKHGTFMLEKNIMSSIRSTPVDSSKFYDGSFKHLDECVDEPSYTPFPISIK